MASSSEPTGPCPDWILSNTSDVHAARDRSWYTTYTPFQTYMTSFMGGKTDVIGIGDVEIPINLFPNRSDAQAHGTLRLRNVLHAPNILCNIVGGPRTNDYEGIQLGGLQDDDGNGAAITGRDGRRLAYFEARDTISLWSLKLSDAPIGPVVGRSYLINRGPNTSYMIHAFWPVSERRKWAVGLSQLVPSVGPASSTVNHKVEASSACNQSHETQAVLSPYYTPQERDWLIREWGGEARFLASHGLSFEHEGERSMGKKIAGVLMSRARRSSNNTPAAGASSSSRAEPSSHSDVSSPIDNEANNGGKLNKDGSQPEVDKVDEQDDIDSSIGHPADFHFTDEELAFIRRGWGNSEAFMLSFGLKFFFHDDCEEAKTIVKALMSDDDEPGPEFSGSEGLSARTELSRGN